MSITGDAIFNEVAEICKKIGNCGNVFKTTTQFVMTPKWFTAVI